MYLSSHWIPLLHMILLYYTGLCCPGGISRFIGSMPVNTVVIHGWSFCCRLAGGEGRGEGEGEERKGEESRGEERGEGSGRPWFTGFWSLILGAACDRVGAILQASLIHYLHTA